MSYRSAQAILTGLLLLAVTACNGERGRVPSVAASDAEDASGPLYSSAASTANRPTSMGRPGIAIDPIVVHDCRLNVIEKQDVASQREGILLFVGTELCAGRQSLLMVPHGLGPVLLAAEVAAGERNNRIITVRLGNEEKKFRRLKEDDAVVAGQLLAQLDDRLARDDWSIKSSKYSASKADLAAAEKTRDEAKNRFGRQAKLRAGSSGAVSEEELSATRLTYDRYLFEAISKREAVRLAELERNQAQTVLDMHQIRSTIPGVIKTIYKKRGEAIKSLEPVFQVHDLSRLRVEGLVDVEYLPRLRKGMTAVVEPARSEGPEQTLLGHLQEITAVAVSKDVKNPLIVSASDDGSVRIWERSARSERRILGHPAPVRAVACTSSSAKANWCLTGATDGVARIWDLDASSAEPLRELKDEHRSAITCVAFSPDGKYCVTGGDDRDMILWKADTGECCYRFPASHRAAVTALQFAPGAQLVSASRDNTVKVWTLSKDEARLEYTIDRRSGDVPIPGVRLDGRQILLDQGKALRLLSLPERRTEAMIENSGEANPFTTFALFSPDARLILTAGAAEGRLQLWRAPTAATRAYELRQLVARERSPATCAAFAPNGAFLVTGTKDRQVLIWPLPSRQEIEKQLTAEVTLIEQAVESSARQVRIWAEVANFDGQLLPGTTVTLAIYPK